MLLDCGTSASSRLRGYGLNPEHLIGVALTHFHPDHASGLAAFIMDEWLLGRHCPLSLCANAHGLDRARQLLDLFGWQTWPEMFPLEFCRAPDETGGLVLQDHELVVRSAPVRHLIPPIAYRVESKASSQAVVFSGDSQPCPELATLAHGADLLFHEATGAEPGHSDAAQAGQAAARGLMLIHCDPGLDRNALCASARSHFNGPVTVAEDGLQVEV